MRESIKQVRGNFADDLHIIAEPGRYFAGDCATLAVRVFGRRIIFDYTGVTDYDSLPIHERDLAQKLPIAETKYYVGDGVYGWFNSIFYDHVIPDFIFYDKNAKEITGRKKYVSHIFGPTCDSLDCILKKQEIPLLEEGDWVVCKAFGAYT